MSGSSNSNNGWAGEQVRYKLTGMLKSWLDQHSADPESLEYVQEILKIINNYADQLRNTGKQGAKAGHEAIDKIFASAAEEDKQKIQCKKGCTACCYIDASITEVEAELIIDYCQENDLEIDRSYLKKQAARGRKEYSEISKCVFLENDLCRIYEARPAISRKHFVFSDPALCDSSKNRDIPLNTYFDLQSEIVASAMMNISETGSIEIMILKQLENDIL